MHLYGFEHDVPVVGHTHQVIYEQPGSLRPLRQAVGEVLELGCTWLNRLVRNIIGLNITLLDRHPDGPDLYTIQ